MLGFTQEQLICSVCVTMRHVLAQTSGHTRIFAKTDCCEHFKQKLCSTALNTKNTDICTAI